MVYFWTAATQMATKLEQLQNAELQLLEVAKRQFQRQQQSRHHHMPQVHVVNTPIPASAVVPNVNRNDNNKSILSRWFCNDDDVAATTTATAMTASTEAQEQEQLIMHSIHVQNDMAVQKTTPLVLLHGYMNGGAYFYRNWMGLSHYFANIHAVDLLGWGLSSRPDYVSITNNVNMDDDNNNSNNNNNQSKTSIRLAEDFFVESLESWRQQQNIDKMILAGHSMGGYLSVAYCERYPQHVDRLILISPAGVPDETVDDVQRRQQRYLTTYRAKMLFGVYTGLFGRGYTAGDVLRALPVSSGRGRIEQYVTHRLPAITDTYEQQTLTDYLYYNNALPGSGEYCLSRLLKPTTYGRDPLVHRIPNLRIPTCDFLYGESDWMDSTGGLAVERACQQKQLGMSSNATASTTPKINVYQVRNAGHLLMLENNVEFNNALVLAAGMGALLDANDVNVLPRKLRLQPQPARTQQRPNKPVSEVDERSHETEVMA